MLVDSINGVAARCPAADRVIEPPPLPQITLRATNRAGAFQRAPQRVFHLKGLCKLRDRVNGINLISKTSDGSSQAAGERVLCAHMAEETVFTLISFNPVVRFYRHIH